MNIPYKQKFIDSIESYFKGTDTLNDLRISISAQDDVATRHIIEAEMDTLDEHLLSKNFDIAVEALTRRQKLTEIYSMFMESYNNTIDAEPNNT